MRAHNYYAAPGFERAGLRRRDDGWIGERLADPASLFVPVWRNQNLVVEIDGGEPRAVVLSGSRARPADRRGGRRRRAARPRRIGVYRVVEERAHFALDLSAAEAPLDMLRSPALAASGVRRPEHRCGPALCRSAPIGRPARPARGGIAGLGPRDAVLARAPPLLRAVRQPDPERGGRACAALHRPRLQHDAFPAHRPGGDHAGDPRASRR